NRFTPSRGAPEQRAKYAVPQQKHRSGGEEGVVEHAVDTGAVTGCQFGKPAAGGGGGNEEGPHKPDCESECASGPTAAHGRKCSPARPSSSDDSSCTRPSRCPPRAPVACAPPRGHDILRRCCPNSRACDG